MVQAWLVVDIIYAKKPGRLQADARVRIYHHEVGRLGTARLITPKGTQKITLHVFKNIEGPDSNKHYKIQ